MIDSLTPVDATDSWWPHQAADPPFRDGLPVRGGAQSSVAFGDRRCAVKDLGHVVF